MLVRELPKPAPNQFDLFGLEARGQKIPSRKL